jgi:hypothetical protein
MAYEYEGKNHYPKMLYHATENPVVVKDLAEHETYGEGWQESPVYPTDPGAEAAAPAEPEKAKRGRKPKADKPADATEPEATEPEGAEPEATEPEGAEAV